MQTIAYKDGQDLCMKTAGDLIRLAIIVGFPVTEVDPSQHISAKPIQLAKKNRFAKMANDVAESAPRFREWFDASAPELEKLPLDWRELDKRPFLKLLVVKCLRPDRMTQVGESKGVLYPWWYVRTDGGGGRSISCLRT